MKILFLGTGSGMVTRTRSCAGIIVDNKLLDCGTGVLKNIRRAGVSLDSIDEIYITHTHADHCGDFVAILWAMALERRKKPLKVISSRAAARTLNAFLVNQGTPKPLLTFKLKYVTPGSAGVKYCMGVHKPADLAYEIRSSRKRLVYTGDTAPTRKLVKLAAGSEVLIHEASFLSEHEGWARITNHSTAAQAAKVARDAGVRLLVLIHLSWEPGYAERAEAEAKTIFGNAVAAKDFMKLRI